MNLFQAWNRFWFAPTSARPLGVFRIVFGIIALEHLALLWCDLDYWLTDKGLLRGGEARLIAGPWQPSPLQWVQDPLAVRGFVSLVAALAVLFTIGFKTRVMGVGLYLGLLSIHNRNLITASGADVLLIVLAFYLMLSPCGTAFSIDSRRRGTTPEPLIEPWTQRLIQIQLTLIYLTTAYAKLGGSTWCEGSALHYVLSCDELKRFTFHLTEWPSVSSALTYFALFAEFAIPLMLWHRATRLWAIAMGLALHGGIMLTIHIPVFGELMTACYLTFLTPAELGSMKSRILALLSRMGMENIPSRAGGATLELQGSHDRRSNRPDRVGAGPRATRS